MNTKKFVASALGTAAVLPLAGACAKTLAVKRKQSVYTPKGDPELARSYAEKLAEMIRYETVSVPEEDQREKFLGFHALLKELFPLLHQKLEKTEIDGNLLYYWKGKSSERPIVLMSHQDVVPAEGSWRYAPFSGTIADGKIWGRGTGDIKSGVFAFMQAVEELLQSGFTPEQDVYLCSSCTEEVGGDGGPKLVGELQRRGVRPWLLCDEGGGIITEPIKGIPGSFAMIGVVEKGTANVKFTARSAGGHASAPGRNTPIERLAAFIREVQTKKPFRSEMMPEVESMLEGLSQYAGFGMRLLLGNMWLFKPLLVRAMPSISNESAAMLRTTIAFTMQSGSDACNVLPQEASVCANLRFIPHQGMQESLKILEKLAKKHGLEMELLNGNDFCPPVDRNAGGWKHVISTIEKTFPGLAYSPYVMTGATDARFYEQQCESCIRFAPVVYGPEQLNSMHGIDENLQIDCLPGAVEFYKNIILDNTI